LLPEFRIPDPRQAEPSVPNRWRIGFPAWQRYKDSHIDAPYSRERWWDPFNRNKAKGDYPIFGRHTFLNFTGSSDTLQTDGEFTSCDSADPGASISSGAAAIAVRRISG
jgi:hypothetical protein